ncbi:MAG TPA: hypothetical protein VIK14_13255 [Ignavibacteria bacterium]
MQKTNQILKRLEEWSNSLNYVIKDLTPQILDALDKTKPLPENCPSNASLADLISDGIFKKLSEVNSAYNDLKEAIWEEGK